MQITVVGHKIPDSDSICSSIALSYLLNKIGNEATPARLGKLNPETEFILKKFNQKVPEYKDNFAGLNVYIVDHSDIALAPDDIDKATIVGIIDHHKLGDLTTSTPLECWIRPVGCSATIVKEIYDYHKVTIPKEIAGIMACTILSDTVIFKSPTTTKKDKEAVHELSSIAGIKDYKELGLEMFKAKSNIDGVSPKDLIQRDFKKFKIGSHSIAIGQLETVDITMFDDIISDLKIGMQELKNEGNFSTIMLFLTDIIDEGSTALIYSDDQVSIENEFKIKFNDNQAYMKGILSRKKQIVPFLTKALS